jgi:GMP synthase (glutamine-hydrolysing)
MAGSFLLLQVRDDTDPMREHEVDCFCTVLGLDGSRPETFDLLSGLLPESRIDAADMVLLGGSGKYSAAGEGEWLDRALESLRRVHQSKTPTFASCWGFQAMARAMGGVVEHRPHLAEVGTFVVETTAEGRRNPLFSQCGDNFAAHLGHEDFVTKLPPDTTLLARTERSLQAFCFNGRPIYCTQFHPELTKADMDARLSAYPEYVELFSDGNPDDTAPILNDTPVAANLLPEFARLFVNP